MKYYIFVLAVVLLAGIAKAQKIDSIDEYYAARNKSAPTSQPAKLDSIDAYYAAKAAKEGTPNPAPTSRPVDSGRPRQVGPRSKPLANVVQYYFSPSNDAFPLSHTTARVALSNVPNNITPKVKGSSFVMRFDSTFEGEIPTKEPKDVRVDFLWVMPNAFEPTNGWCQELKSASLVIDGVIQDFDLHENDAGNVYYWQMPFDLACKLARAKKVTGEVFGKRINSEGDNDGYCQLNFTLSDFNLKLIGKFVDSLEPDAPPVTQPAKLDSVDTLHGVQPNVALQPVVGVIQSQAK